MKCKICGAKTTLNKSFGKENFIVCPDCYEEIVAIIENCRTIKASSQFTALSVILEIGYLKEGGK